MKKNDIWKSLIVIIKKTIELTAINNEYKKGISKNVVIILLKRIKLLSKHFRKTNDCIKMLRELELKLFGNKMKLKIMKTISLSKLCEKKDKTYNTKSASGEIKDNIYHISAISL